MEQIKSILKSNKGFTMQDLVLAIIVIILLTGTIGGTYLSVYKVQADTKVDAVATVFAVQIMEQIDKIAYSEITEENKEEFISKLRNEFTIATSFSIALQIIPYEQDDLVKTVKLTINYTFSGKEKAITIERLKVKEI